MKQTINRFILTYGHRTLLAAYLLLEIAAVLIFEIKSKHTVILLMVAAAFMGWMAALEYVKNKDKDRDEDTLDVTKIVDQALGLEQLPPVRVDKGVADKLRHDAKKKGVIIQAHLRDIIYDHTPRTVKMGFHQENKDE
jgi:hypothetical protein